MITDGIEEAIEHFVEETMCVGVEANNPEKKVKRIVVEDLEAKCQEMKTLIRAEAINLADKLIGKDRVLHNLTDTDGEVFLDPVDKAIFDYQVQQRLELAKYQNEPKLGPTDPEGLINTDLSENEE